MSDASSLDTLSMDSAAISPQACANLETIQAEIDEVCDRFGPRPVTLPLARNLLDFDLGMPAPLLKPRSVAADFMRTAEGYEIALELPGLDETNVEIAVAADLLTVHAEGQKGPGRVEPDHYYLSERRFGQVMRSFRLPAAADTARMSFRCRNGLLLIQLPRKHTPR